jgi:hypothetical protein
MLRLTESEERALQGWLERRLATISDAEAPILAEYCIALLKHDESPQAVRALCIEQLRDFLKEATEQFVDEAFAAVEARSYMAGAPSHHVRLFEEREERAPMQSVKEPIQADMDFYEQPLPSIDPAMMAAFFTAFMAPPPPLKTCHAFARNGCCPRGDTCRFAHIRPAPAPNATNVALAAASEKARTLTVRHVPRDQLSVQAITQHFKAFGPIERVIVHQATAEASVLFANQASADAARADTAGLSGSTSRQTAATDAIDADTIAHRQQQHQARLFKKQEMLRKSQELEAKKQQLLRRQTEQREAIFRLERSSGQPESRTPLQVQLDELKEKAIALGIDPSVATTTSTAQPKYCKAKLPAQKPYARPMKLDNRPKSLIIHNVRSSHEEGILRSKLAQFSSFKTLTSSSGALLAEFSSRIGAERFVQQIHADGLNHLKLSWSEEPTADRSTQHQLQAIDAVQTA